MNPQKTSTCFHTPRELNFMSRGLLKFTFEGEHYEFAQMYLAQHNPNNQNPKTANWIFGGDNCTKYKSDKIYGNIVTCKSNSQESVLKIKPYLSISLFFIRGHASVSCGNGGSYPIVTPNWVVRVFRSESDMIEKLGSKKSCEFDKTKADIEAAFD